MAMFENFPYTDMHNLNLDWIIKIAKDFLDQYTHIQQLISDGEISLQNLTESGLEQLQNKADNLEQLLNEWYNTHSEDIANQLSDALQDINDTLTNAISTMNNNLATATYEINTRADAKLQEILGQIPSDYTALFNSVIMMQEGLNAIVNGAGGFIELNKGDTIYGSEQWGKRATSTGYVDNTNYSCYTFQAIRDGFFYVTKQATQNFGVLLYNGIPDSNTFVQDYTSAIPTQENPLVVPAGYYVCINSIGSTSDVWSAMCSCFIEYIIFDNNDTKYGTGSLWGKRATSSGITDNSNYACYTFKAPANGLLYCVEPASVYFGILLYAGQPAAATFVHDYSNDIPTENNPIKIPKNYYVCINKNSSSSVTWKMAFSGFNPDITPTELLIDSIENEFYKTPISWIENAYISRVDGQIVYNATPTPTAKYWITDYIYCHNCKQVICIASYSGNNVGYIFTDENKRVIYVGGNDGNRYDELTINIPENAYYFVNTSRTNDNETETTENIKLTYDKQSLGHESIVNTNPMLSGITNGGLTGLFRKMGFIGDSLMAGACFYEESGEYHGGDTEEYAWGKFLSRDSGSDGYIFAEGGLTVRTWWTHQAHTQNFITNLCQAYFIGLGVNDRKQDATNVPIGSPSDIDFLDYNNNADTYYGGYAKIIQYIKSLVPKAKIFVITNPKNNDEYNTAVRYMATTFDNVYLIDLFTYGNEYYTNTHLGNMWVYGHLSASGYRQTAYYIGSYVNDIIKKNIGEFNDVIGILP